jgi:hypothetical protein
MNTTTKFYSSHESVVVWSAFDVRLGARSSGLQAASMFNAMRGSDFVSVPPFGEPVEAA